MMLAQFAQRRGFVDMLDKMICCFHVGIITYLSLFVLGCGIKQNPYYKTPPETPQELFRLPNNETGVQRVPGVPLLDEDTLKPKTREDNGLSL